MTTHKPKIESIFERFVILETKYRKGANQKYMGCTLLASKIEIIIIN